MSKSTEFKDLLLQLKPEQFLFHHGIGGYTILFDPGEDISAAKPIFKHRDPNMFVDSTDNKGTTVTINSNYAGEHYDELQEKCIEKNKQQAMLMCKFIVHGTAPAEIYDNIAQILNELE